MKFPIVVMIIFVSVLITGCAGRATLASRGGKSGGDSAVPPVNTELRVPPEKANEIEKQEGPYYSLLTLESSEIEARIGKPSSGTNLGNLKDNFSWRYDEMGLTLNVTTLRSNGKQMATTLFQSKGRVIGTLSIGDSEEKVVAVAGPIKTTSKGDRIAQFTAEQCVFTLTIEQGKLTKARIEPMGREG